MKNPLSHNKTIKFMHETTGLPYSVCRKKLKENQWDLFYALGYGEALKIINEILYNGKRVIEDLVENLVPAINTLADACRELAERVVRSISEINWKEVIDEYNRQNNIEALPETISGETAGTEA